MKTEGKIAFLFLLRKRLTNRRTGRFTRLQTMNVEGLSRRFALERGAEQRRSGATARNRCKALSRNICKMDAVIVRI